MDRTRRQGIVFLVLGTSFNTMGILNKNNSLKISFIGLGTIFLVIAITRFMKWRKENNKQ